MQRKAEELELKKGKKSDMELLMSKGPRKSDRSGAGNGVYLQRGIGGGSLQALFRACPVLDDAKNNQKPNPSITLMAGGLLSKRERFANTAFKTGKRTNGRGQG